MTRMRVRHGREGRRRGGRGIAPWSVAEALLGLVVVLFTCLCIQQAAKLWRGDGTRHAAERRVREEAAALGREALDEAWGVLVRRAAIPADPLHALLRMAPGDALHEVDRIGETLVPLVVPEAEATLGAHGLGLVHDVVLGRVLVRHPFRPGGTPHRGTVRLEATVVEGERILCREIVTRGYRLLRVRLPKPFVDRALTVLRPGALLDRAGDPELATLRRDRAEAVANLRQLAERRRRVSVHLVEVRVALQRYLGSFRHLMVEIPNPLPSAQELFSHFPSVRTSWPAGPLDHPAVLWTGADAVDLAEWSRFSIRLAELVARREARREAYRDASERWDRTVRRAFRSSHWETLATAEEVEDQVSRVGAELLAALGDLSEAFAAWVEVEEELLERYERVGQRFRLEGKSEAARLASRLEELAPETLDPQVTAWLEGPEAPARLAGPAVLRARGAAGLTLAGTRVEGEVLLLVDGDVLLEDLRVGEGGLLTVVCQGRATLRGQVRASLLARGGLSLQPGATLEGSLVLPQLGAEDELRGRVSWDPRVAAPGSLEAGTLEGLVVRLDE